MHFFLLLLLIYIYKQISFRYPLYINTHYIVTCIYFSYRTTVGFVFNFLKRHPAFPFHNFYRYYQERRDNGYQWRYCVRPGYDVSGKRATRREHTVHDDEVSFSHHFRYIHSE